MTKKEQRIKKLTEYLQRLGAGEELEECKKRFYKRIFGCTGIGDHGAGAGTYETGNTVGGSAAAL